MWKKKWEKKVFEKRKKKAPVDEEPVILIYETEQICWCCKDQNVLINTPFLVYSCVMGVV